MTSCWDTLGVASDSSEREIKRAYAKRLKQTRPEDDPEGFQALRQAYELALEYAAHARREAEAADLAENAAEAAPASVAESNATSASTSATSVADQRHEPAASTEPDSTGNAPPKQDAIVKVVGHLWEKFISNSNGMTKEKFRRFMAGQGAFHNLTVREAFEYRACCYIANGEVELPMMEVLFAGFDWENDIRHLRQINPEVVQVAIERFNANRIWHTLYYNESFQNPALKAMLENRMTPLRDTFLLFKKSNVQALQQWIHSIVWHYPEVLKYKVNPDVLDYWQKRANSKRYFFDDAMMSLVIGAPLALVFRVIQQYFQVLVLGIDGADGNGWHNLLFGELCAFILVAFYRFLLPDIKIRVAGHTQGLLDRGQRFYTLYLHSLFAEHRYKNRVHWQVVANFGMASTTLGFHWQGNGELLQALLLGQAVLGLMFIASADMTWIKWLAAPVFGFFAASLSIRQGGENRFLVDLLFFCGIYLLYFRGHLALLRHVGDVKLIKLRWIWLLFALPLAIAMKLELPHSISSHPLLPCLLWLVCLCGWQVADFYLNAAGIIRFFSHLLLLASLGIVTPELPPVSMFLFLHLCIIGTFVISNQIFARLHSD